MWPGSRCPSCREGIAFYDNVPIVSWLLLKGRCRKCKWMIPNRYPLVEALVGGMFLAAALLYGPSLYALATALLSAASVILVATDLESRVLPDEVTRGVLALGLVLALVRDLAAHRFGSTPFLRWTVTSSLLGVMLGAGLLLLVRWGYKAVRGVEGMGMGDVKMIAMIGAFTGPFGVLLTLFFASFSGALLGGALVAGRRISWTLARRRASRGPRQARETARRAGLLVDGEGLLICAGKRWEEIPGAAPAGSSIYRSGEVARPAAAFVRLAIRRARNGRGTETGRLFLDDGRDFFRVLALRAEVLPGEILILISRADIPFGVFLAAGSLAAFVLGRNAVALLLGDLSLPGLDLLP